MGLNAQGLEHILETKGPTQSMKWITRLLTILLGVMCLFPIVHASEPVLRLIVFWSQSCPHCHTVLNETLPPLQEEYGDSLEVLTFELSEPRNYQLWQMATDMFEVPVEDRGVPMLFIGDNVLIGSYDIPQKLPDLLKGYLVAGGVDYPAIPGLLDAPGAPLPPATATPRPTPTLKECHLCDDEPGAPSPEPTGDSVIGSATPTTVPKQPAGIATPPSTSTPTAVARASDPTPIVAAPPVHLAYFFQPGCRECDRVQLALDYLQSQYPQLVIHSYDIQAEAALAEWLGQQAGVPEDRRLIAPAVFIGDEALVDQDVYAHSLESLIERYVESGAHPFWEDWDDSQAEVTSAIVERFRSFGVFTVLVAGLIDGLNPCAFATIVFFISYLSFMGRRGREILLVGGAFALGVFLTYLGLGFGVLKFLASLPFLHTISRWVFGLTAGLCLLFAAGSLYDWWQIRKGRPESMKLRLPGVLRRRVNRVIRDGAQGRAIIPLAFVSGVAVSIIELACTGQVYLPTILFVLGVEELRARAGWYLVLYNLMFVLPLIIVLLLAYWGTSSQRLATFINNRSGAIKLITAGLFVVLAGWLLALVL